MGGHQVGRALVEQDVSVIHDDAVVDDLLQVLDDVRRQEDGLPFRLGIVSQVLAEKPAVARIEAEGEIVQHQQVGILGEDEAQGHLGALPVRHPGNLLPGRDLELLHQGVIGVAIPLRVEGSIETFDLLDRHVGILHVSFQQQGDAAARHRGDALHLLAEDPAGARLRLEVSHQDVDGRGLAGPVLAEQADDGPFLHFEVQVFVDLSGTIIMRQVLAADDCFHGRGRVIPRNGGPALPSGPCPRSS